MRPLLMLAAILVTAPPAPAPSWQAASLDPFAPAAITPHSTSLYLGVMCWEQFQSSHPRGARVAGLPATDCQREA